MAAVGIFCAMVLDSLDGRVARMTNTQSAFGEQMDSLSDMVSFGAAPALIAYEWALRGLGKPGWIAAFVYCSCAALRLARFNTNIGVVDKRFFQGLPSPAAAAIPAIEPPEGPTSRTIACSCAHGHGSIAASQRKSALAKIANSWPTPKYAMATTEPRRCSR